MSTRTVISKTHAVQVAGLSTWALHAPDGAVLYRTLNKAYAEVDARLRDDPAACPTCINGCDCTTDQGCDHYGCWGSRAVTTCIGAPAVKARTDAALRIDF